jgi:hypothetical protein
MRALSAVELLNAWDDSAAQAPLERALELLAVAFPEASADSLAALSIGQRDARLLMLRQALWGPHMPAVVACPACRDQLELSLDSRNMLADSRLEQPGEMSLDISGYSLTFRLPTSFDLMAGPNEADSEAARTMLLQRCLLSAHQQGNLIDSNLLPEEVIQGVVQSMSEADPLADIQLRLACPSCQHTWRSAFDIVSFLWTEIEAWAKRILRDIHTLAAAYGWCERDILSLSPMRRQRYLEMVGYE